MPDVTTANPSNVSAGKMIFFGNFMRRFHCDCQRTISRGGSDCRMPGAPPQAIWNIISVNEGAAR
jgi:hypothetical protein